MVPQRVARGARYSFAYPTEGIQIIRISFPSIISLFVKTLSFHYKWRSWCLLTLGEAAFSFVFAISSLLYCQAIFPLNASFTGSHPLDKANSGQRWSFHCFLRSFDSQTNGVRGRPLKKTSYAPFDHLKQSWDETVRTLNQVEPKRCWNTGPSCFPRPAGSIEKARSRPPRHPSHLQAGTLTTCWPQLLVLCGVILNRSSSRWTGKCFTLTPWSQLSSSFWSSTCGGIITFYKKSKFQNDEELL